MRMSTVQTKVLGCGCKQVTMESVGRWIYSFCDKHGEMIREMERKCIEEQRGVDNRLYG
jgi:hypothetical protein